MDKYMILIITAIIMGTAARVLLMKVDYRQYPTYPQSYLSHFTLGMIAAGLGAVAIPALVAKEYVAITFLAIAAQQFRDVRNMERQSLDNIEPTELVPRGTAYIEDIAKAFEARNYIATLTALATGLGLQLGIYFKASMAISILVGMFSGIIIFLGLKRLLRSHELREIAEVKAAEIDFEGPLLKINDLIIMNIGLTTAREVIKKQGMAVEIIPNDANGIAILSNIGQRQAILHNAATQLGIRKDVDEPDFTPIARRNPQNGNIVMIIVTMEPDIDCLIEAVKKTPVLESSKRKPLDSTVGKKHY